MWVPTDIPGLYYWQPTHPSQVIFGALANAAFSWWAVAAFIASLLALSFLILLISDLAGRRSGSTERALPHDGRRPAKPLTATERDRLANVHDSPNLYCICDSGHYVYSDDTPDDAA